MRKLIVMLSAVGLTVSFALARPAAAEDAAPANYRSYCTKCHGDGGKGDGPGSAVLNPRPRDFSNCAKMKKRSDDDLFKVISEGGDSVGLSADMQSWSGTLKEEEIRGLIKFVRAFCKEP